MDEHFTTQKRMKPGESPQVQAVGSSTSVADQSNHQQVTQKKQKKNDNHEITPKGVNEGPAARGMILSEAQLKSLAEGDEEFLRKVHQKAEEFQQRRSHTTNDFFTKNEALFQELSVNLEAKRDERANEITGLIQVLYQHVNRTAELRNRLHSIQSQTKVLHKSVNNRQEE